MTKHCPTCPTPNACDIGNLCAYRDMDVIERAMNRTTAADHPQMSDLERFGPWIAAVIIMAFVIWALSVSIPAGVML